MTEEITTTDVTAADDVTEEATEGRVEVEPTQPEAEPAAEAAPR